MRTILLAEDEVDLRMMVALFLRKQGYKVAECADGAEAWRRLQGRAVDMAVLDVNMPFVDGLELCQRIRTDPRLRELAVLMLTIRKEAPEQIEGYEAGADDYLPKPFEFPVLLARLRALERRTHRAAR